jgi:hypothetical protein
MSKLDHIEQTHNSLIFSSLDANPLCSVALERTFFNNLNPITMTNYRFSIITYTALDGSCIVKTEKFINVRRMQERSAEDYIRNKYKMRDGFFIELNSSWSI